MINNIKRIFLFLLICIIIFFIGGIIIEVLLNFFKNSYSISYSSWKELFIDKELYVNGSIFLIGFFLNFIANKVNILRNFFPMVIAGHSLTDSGYEYLNKSHRNCLYKKVKEEIIICAQNHHFIANPNLDESKKSTPTRGGGLDLPHRGF